MDELRLEVPAAADQKVSPLAISRLVAAGLLTFAMLPYAAGRTVVVGLLTGAPERPYLSTACATMIVIAILTLGLAKLFAGRPWARWIPWIVGSGWIVSNLVVMFGAVGPLLEWYRVALVFVPAMLWLPWLAWYFYPVTSFVPRTISLLALGGIAFGVFGYVLKVDGLTGDSKVNFTWKWATPDKPMAAELAAESPGDAKFGNADLSTTTADDYPQYLGPNRTGMIAESKFSADWKAISPKIVWRKPIGLGWGAFAIVGKFAVTQEQRGPSECVVCYRVSDGSQIWVHAQNLRFVSGMGGDGPRATPTIAGGKVYAIGATGMLVCLNGADGKLIWGADVLVDNEAVNNYHGVCGSPLVFDDKVIVSPTGSNGLSLAAYNVKTGERVWRAGDKRTSYSSPVLATIAGTRQILLHNAHELTGHDVTDGHILWRFPWTNETHVNCSQPIANSGGPNQVFISTGYEGGAALLKIQKDNAGNDAVEVAWQNRYLKSKFATVVETGGYLYGLDDGILTCLELKTGKRKWKGGRYQHGQILLAGKLLIVQAESGDVVLVQPNPDGLKELGRFPALNGKTWNHPALSGRFLLVRNDTEAVCLELPADSLAK